MGIGRIAAGLAISTAAVFMSLPQARAETLADALAHAYEFSGLLEQNRALLRAADENVAQAVALLRPVLSWAASATISNPRPTNPVTGYQETVTTQISLNAEWLLFDFGASNLAIDAQKALVLATRQDLVGIEQQVLLRAVEAYLNLRRNQEFVALRQNNVRLITQELRAAQDRYDVGEVTRTEVSLAEAALAQARSLLASAEGDLARATQEFRAAIGRAPQSPQAAGPIPLELDEQAATAFALRNHPDILAAQQNVRVADLNLARAEAASAPRVTLNSSVTMREVPSPGLELDTTGQVGIGVGGPITRGGALASQVRQAMAQRDAQRSTLHIIQQQIQQQVANAYALLRVAQASRTASQEQIRASEVAFEGVREEAALGTRTTIDVLGAEQDLLNARTNAVSAQVDEVIASYAVLSAMGLLTADYLNLGVQTYDPSTYYDLVKDAPAASSDRGRALDRVLRAIGN